MRAAMNPIQGTTPSAPLAGAAGVRLQLGAAGRAIVAGARAVDLEPKDALLLAYMAVEGPTPRGRLAALLWPDVDEERARGNLRQRLLRLRRAVGIELVVGQPVARLADRVTHDLHDCAELLSGLDLSQAGALAEWLEANREKRLRARADWLDAACTQAEAQGDLATALEHAHALVTLDPLSEHAHRRVIKLHYLRGDTAAALAAYERCREILRRELKTRPSAETEALRALLTAEAPARLPTVRAVPLAVLRPPRLVGRDTEWEALQSAWEQGQPAFVLGEAGMGKTRLVTDLAHVRQPVLLVGARPGDERVVYAVIARLLRQISRERLSALQAGVRKELARLLPELGEAEPIRSDAERARFYNAVAAALAAQRETLHGVIVDDLHYADDASVELMQYLLGAVELGWVFAARPAELGQAAQSLLERVRERANTIELAPLTEAAIAELVESLALPGIDAARVAPQLLRQTGGNPLFLLETLKSWLAQGAAPEVRLPAPGSVGALIERRIGRLSPEAIRLARCAAIAGQDFSVELAAHVLGVRPLDLADAWAELEHAQVFRDGAFAHDLIAEAARASVPPPVARELHGEVARLLADRGAPAARLAEHWLAAGRAREALQALLRAAASARQETLRLTEAAKLYEQAVAVAESIGDHDQAFEALHALADTWLMQDRERLDEALVHRTHAHATTPQQRARALSLHGHVLLHRGRLAESLAASQRAAEEARRAGDEELAVSSLADAAAAASLSGDAERAVRILRPLLPWTLERGSDDTRINVLGNLGMCLDNIDHQPEAQAMHQRAIEAALSARRFSEAVVGFANFAVSLLDVGKPKAALEAIAEARRIGAAYDALGGSASNLNLFEGIAALALRRYRQAHAAFEAALADLAHHAPSVAATHVHRACLWLQLGQYARAQRELKTIENLQDLPPWLLARREQMLGRCAWATERRDEALRHWHAAAEQAPGGSRAVLSAMIALDMALLQPLDRAIESARTVLVRAERLGHEGSALAARIRIALFACAAGDQNTARQTLEEIGGVPAEIEPNDLYAGERWLATVRVLYGCGRRSAAEHALREAVNWVNRIAREYVPAEFRDSFLHRNPVNRELLTLATRLK